MTKSPCKNCEDRHDWCHSKCDRYQAFRAECDKVRTIKNREAEVAVNSNEVHLHNKKWRGMK